MTGEPSTGEAPMGEASRMRVQLRRVLALGEAFTERKAGVLGLGVYHRVAGYEAIE